MKFKELSQYFQRLEETTSRIEMSNILAEMLRKATHEDIDKVVYLTLGEILPPFRGIQMGVSEKLMMDALSKASSVKISQVEKLYKLKGDIGETAIELVNWEGKELSVRQVYDELLDIATTRGTKDKVLRIMSLIKGLSSLEAKYAARIIVGRLRLGVGDATLIEALANLINGKEYKDAIERAYNLCSDLGLVAKVLVQTGIEGIREFKIKVGYPIRMALAERVTNVEEIIKRLGRCAIEAKYDGFRLQVHKKGKDIEIYSRNLERMTDMFPDVKEAVLQHVKCKEVIIEGEAITYNEETGEFYPFQITIQRKRKYGVSEYAKEFPLKLFTFDLLYLEGEDFTSKPFIERRKRLEEILPKNSLLLTSEMFITDNVKDIEKFFEDVVSRGLEGIMAKRLDAPYTAGSRNFNWIKLKRSYKGSLADTIDVVIVGYFYGKGARTKLGIGALLTALYDPQTDTFKTISKVGSGFTEDEWVKLKDLLDQIKIPHKHARVDSLLEADVWVEPKYVITVTADEITRSPLHTAGRTSQEPGFALRFPRAVGFIRGDKKAEDANTVDEIVKMYKMQKKVSVE
ncbi:ATP-dependent DNA ligase [Hydrogenobacter thermophilus]|uniref:ATP-dependent DNA ligase n=1 Tax=Hydrogenobacter thermophilus TaxID=940 RepID=UPI0030F72AEF